MIVAYSDDPEIRFLLDRHPHVTEVAQGNGPVLRFNQGDWVREIRIGDPSVEVYGLMELMDNNPVVCADVVSVPSPASTLALVALGPLAWSGILADNPAFITNVDATEEDLASALRTVGWNGGLNLHIEPKDLDDVYVATAMAAIDAPEDPSDIEGLYEERFGHSFYVRKADEADWDPALVRGTARTYYRLSLALDKPHSLLTVRVLADRRGKCGAAQIVHAMNVMCGFEESLGID